MTATAAATGLERLHAGLLALVRTTAAAEAADDGWFVSREQAARLLEEDADGAPAGRLEQLAERFGLSAPEQRLVLACLAAELNPRYAKVYGYLHDDLTRRRTSLHVALELERLDGDAGEAERALLDPRAAVFRWGLVTEEEDPARPRADRGLALDPDVLGFLLGGGARATDGGDEEADPAAVERLTRLLAERELLICFHGPAAAEGRAIAAAACRRLGRPLAEADLGRLAAASQERAAPFAAALRGELRRALLSNALLYLSGLDALQAGPYAREHAAAVAELAAEAAWPVCVQSTRLWTPQAPVVPFALALPGYRDRRAAWLRAAPELAPEDVEMLADRFPTTVSEIAQAAALGRRRARSGVGPPAAADFAWACRARAHARLEDLAQVVEPRATWADLILPRDVQAQLHELCGQVRRRARVLHDWGFDHGATRGHGLAALFLGPSGTGKTLAAEVVAGALEAELVKVDLAAVMSKYVGETEKNLQRVLSAADTSGSVLFFDEADALFGRRSEISDAHDRYANIEVSFLLARLEDYEGVAILASNLAQNIDDAFLRRIRVTVEFPFPDEAARAGIWRAHLPAAAPVAADVDVERLARSFRIPGGVIRKIAWNGAFLAADEGDDLRMEHLLRAARREYDRIGKPYPSVEARP